MLRLLNYTKDFIPAKRVYERKPSSKVAFETNGIVLEITLNNN